MDTNHAPAACPNPACECDPCHCERPCTCGLMATQHSTHETWDPARNEYRYIEIQTFQPTHPLPGGSSGTDGHARHGDHGGHADHGSTPATGGAVQHGEHAGHGENPAANDLATYDVAAAVAGFDPDGRALSEVARRAEQVAAQSHDHESMSIRSADHNGHTIEIVTTYELRINGEPLTGHMGVNADGTVHYHGIPNYATESAVDLAKQIVDSFPDDYSRPGRPGAAASDENGAN